MESFQTCAIQMLKEFRALLQISPISITSHRLLQLISLNMYAIACTELKGESHCSQLESRIRWFIKNQRTFSRYDSMKPVVLILFRTGIHVSHIMSHHRSKMTCDYDTSWYISCAAVINTKCSVMRETVRKEILINSFEDDLLLRVELAKPLHRLVGWEVF